MQLGIAGLAPVKWNNHRMHNIDLSDVVSDIFKTYFFGSVFLHRRGSVCDRF